MSENRTSYIMLQITDVASLASILDELSLIPGIDALTSKQLKTNTILYMQFSSGMGLGTFTFALVGLFVAIVIISLTTYTMTMEKVPEYGTLKAIGASRWDIAKILLEQVLWSAICGYLIGLTFSLLLMFILNNYTLVPIEISAVFAFICFLVTVVFSLTGSFSSIKVVNKIDPAIVFRR